MSIKTLRKRIALVAVSALGVGLLSVAPASAAAGASAIFSDEYTVASTYAAGANEGVCYASDASTTTYTADAVATAAQNAANKVEMTTTGKLKFTANSQSGIAATSDYLAFTITGPAIWDSFTANSVPATPSLNNAQKELKFTFATDNTRKPADAVFLKPTGAGAITVEMSYYDASGDAGTETVTVKVWNITAKTACAAQSPSLADSYVAAVGFSARTTAITSSNDASGATTTTNGESIYIRTDIYDANGVAVPGVAATGTVTAEVTGGLVIGENNTIGTVNNVWTVSKAVYFRITQGTANTPQTGTVTVKINGVVVGTKTVTITGPVAKIEVSSPVNVRIGQTQSAANYEMLDSAGNKLAVAVDGYATLTDAQAKIATAGSSTTTPAPSTATKGVVSLNCSGSTGGLVKGLQLKEVVSATVTVLSAPFDIQCGSNTAATYTASLDKASYVPGDIATLTITAKDPYGNPVSDDTVLGSSSAGEAVAISGSNMTAVTAPTNADTFTGGKKTYKFIVGATEGSYNLVVDLDKWTTVTYNQAALTVPYTIKASTASVSTNEVLAAIVKLIATINKQIRQLQKQLRR